MLVTCTKISPGLRSWQNRLRARLVFLGDSRRWRGLCRHGVGSDHVTVCNVQHKLPLVLCGDFNSPTTSAVYKLLASNFDHGRLR